MQQTLKNNLNVVQLNQLAGFGKRISRLGLNFAAFDAMGEIVAQSKGSVSETDWQEISAKLNQSGFDSIETAMSNILSGNLVIDDQPLAYIFVDMGNDENNSGASNESQRNYLQELLNIFIESFKSNVKSQQQMEMVSSELAQTYEELVLLYKISTNMKITDSDANYLQMACDVLTDIVDVEGIAIVHEKKVDDIKELVLIAGAGLIDIDNEMTHTMYDRLCGELNVGKEALLDSEVDSSFTYTWPDKIKNIIIVPLYVKDKVVGFMVAINRVDKPDFDSTDVKLFNSVANECAVFIQNGQLFRDLEELFIGSLKALTKGIDAKDRYTRGHSERVAFVSRWIAERLADEGLIEESLVHKSYLAGLLHDIGKIGIEESVLSKDGKLDESEFQHIRTHPLIGAAIVSDIKPMRDIVPGVLAHHERLDGKGYPNGLSGEQVPLLGRIICLADSFDAMTSKRTYRNAMDLSAAVEEIKKNIGTQFDEEIARVFLESDLDRLWEILQSGSDTTTHGQQNNFSEYGTAAVGVLIR